MGVQKHLVVSERAVLKELLKQVRTFIRARNHCIACAGQLRYFLINCAMWSVFPDPITYYVYYNVQYDMSTNLILY